MNSYSPHENEDKNTITTAEDLLAALRKGNSQKLEIGLGALKVPCRLLSAVEEVTLVVKAKQQAMKQNPTGLKQEVFESYETMRSILQAVTTINGAPSLPMGFLEALTGDELSMLYDQYVSMNHMINPNLQTMKPEEIMALVDGIKKKDLNVSTLYSWQLQEVGKYFLETLVPMSLMVSERGL